MTIPTSGTGIIREVIELGTVDSTNTYALEAGRVGLLVTASRQTAGRGRQGRPWFSPEHGNLYLTLTVGSTDPRLTIVAGVAAHEAVTILLDGRHTPEIKWPNDLIAGPRKLCGILCETRGSMAVVGIGLNVNGTSWPPELEGRAVSLAELAGSPLDRGLVLHGLAHALEKWFGIFFRSGFEPVREGFLRHGMLRTRELFTEQGEPCVILDMDKQGQLIIDVSGARQSLMSGTILVKT